MYLHAIEQIIYVCNDTKPLCCASRAEKQDWTWYTGEQERAFVVHELASPNKHKASKTLGVEKFTATLMWFMREDCYSCSSTLS